MESKHEHRIHQVVDYQKEANISKGAPKDLHWWQLSLIGVGSIIGAGFFLGTGVSISLAGPSILLGYLLGGLIAGLVFGALAEMSVQDPQPGSFRVYATKAFGRRIGFLSGWLYWIAGILIVSSEVTALAVFTRFWLPHVPLWIFSGIYTLLGLLINLAGAKNFGRIESFFGIVKMSLLVSFILFGAVILLGIEPQKTLSLTSFLAQWHWSVTGPIGLWSSLVLVLFSYGGIEVVGIASTELRNKTDTPKAGAGVIISLTLLYVIGLYFVLTMTPWIAISVKASPFVTALSSFNIPYINSAMNLIIISAAFSTMVGALFAMSNILTSLSNEGLAPAALTKKNLTGAPAISLLASTACIGVFIMLGYFLPHNVYEYLSTAAGVALIINWIIILSSHISLGRKSDRTKQAFGMWAFPYTSYLGIFLIIFVLVGSSFRHAQRLGLIISLLLFLAIVIMYQFIEKKTTPGSRH